MIHQHVILDTPTLVALSGNRQVSALIHHAHLEPETQLWAPVLSILQADLEYRGIAQHVGQLDVIHTLDLDYPAALAAAGLHHDGLPLGVAAAVHAVRHLPEWDADALVATVSPKAYEEQRVPLLDLNR